MINSHKRGHGGQDYTLSNFRQDEFWCVQGGKLAKAVRYKCVLCRVMDSVLLQQPLGPIPPDRLLQPTAWGQVEVDLMGPFVCRGEKNPRSSIKVWGLVAIDVNSGASHVDILHDYSTSAVLLTLRRFCALRGWPALISSGVVRSADVEYHTPGPGMKAKGRSITISRSIQRLTVEEQDKPLAVLEDSNSSSVIADEVPTRN